MGRVVQSSNPHGPSETALWTQNQYDALGRVTKVIPPDGSSTTNNTQFLYLGNSLTATDPAGKQRRTYTDALGRIIQVHEPGYSDGVNATGFVTISGTLQRQPSGDPYNPWFYDSGTFSVTAGTFTATYYYECSTVDGICDNKNSVAAGLAAIFNSNVDSPVTASSSGAKLNLRARFAGPQGNLPLSWATTYYPSFPHASLSGTPSGPTLTGGADGTGANGSTPSLSTPLVTVNSYDVLGSLTKVFQGQQQRLYVYDSLGRITSSTTPEAGAVNFTYTDFGSLATRTDARTVTTAYQYDPLHRLIGTSYILPSGGSVSPMPNVCTPSGGQPANMCLSYGNSASANNNGRLVQMTDPAGSESYTYDIYGRVTQVQKSVPGTTYALTYQYNLLNELTQVSYPSGRVFQQQMDAVGRLNRLQSGGVNFLTIDPADYNAAFQPTRLTLGNGVQAAMSYNSRSQLASLAYTSGAGTLMNLTYAYTGGSVTGNNAQIQSITDSADPGRTESFTYDAWGRLRTAQTAGSTKYPAWGLSWDYDRYGNRKAQNVTAGSAFSNQVTPDPATNRLTDAGYAYDASGNMTSDGSNALTYDGENHVTASVNGGASGAYTYDGNGLRVKRVSAIAGTTTTVYLFSGSKVIAEYDNGAAVGSPSREYIYSGGTRIATISGTTTTYHHVDHLSVRTSTDPSGSILKDAQGNNIGEQGHYPFGETWYPAPPQMPSTKWQFTTYERDGESGNDYALARYDVNRLGRFSSPDPLGGSIASPQSLNRYTYAGNDPTNSVDPSGDVTFPCKGQEPCGGMVGGNLPFCWNWNEFDILMFQVGWAPLYHSDSRYFDFEGFSSAELRQFADEGEISLLGYVPVYQSVMLNLSGGGGLDLARTKLSEISRANLKLKDLCKAFLQTLISQNNLNISVDTLLGQLSTVAGDAANYVYDGPSATSVPLDPAAFPGVASAGSRTVADTFANNPGQEAISQYNGSAIWIRADQWSSSLGGLVPSSYASSYGSGTLMHEILHKKAASGGFSHDQMSKALAAAGVNLADYTLGHNPISDALGRICF